MLEEKVILVSEVDEQLGLMAKMEAHEKGILHRAFSVFVFNKNGELLLQQRALDKYHSPGLWTNTCCSHQRDGESNIQAGKRRLQEEMGFNCELKELFWFVYKASFDNGLTEHELDHVMIGHYEDDPIVNLEEAAAFKWMTLEDVKKDMQLQPELYTEWFKIIFNEYDQRLVKL
ncbi:isopentenyl-diphosphate Delta-isomerase [Lutimonas halocynthiae]|uniref:isopentenyl-diphosphate Delta-isomerase n=1 Tax=Lutimonas halocynthiae TaxID=1446477 RepID=UPI0025B54775|nr:isopentenyl-diphosphate Delta-isomerase [Lutimonas halocynthiae]MDN3644213.1 isopentenyl-diphosphate Delta-isomerase [Lutimonas halocynthiae]